MNWKYLLLVTSLLLGAQAVAADADVIQKLKTTTSFDGATTGFAPTRSKNYNAYAEALALGPKIRKDLDVVLAKGSPSARLYAAMLIRKQDKAAGDKALKNLLADKAQVNYCLSGCGISRFTVGDAAKDLLSQKSDPLRDQLGGE